MTGIYIHCNHSLPEPALARQTVKSMIQSSYVMRDSQAAVAASSSCAVGGVFHIPNHGEVPSIGVCQDNSGNILASLGAYWFSPDARE